MSYVRVVRPTTPEHVLNDLDNFPDWLRLVMTERRLSQRDVAARTGISPSTVCHLVKKQRGSNLDTALRVYRGLR